MEHNTVQGVQDHLRWNEFLLPWMNIKIGRGQFHEIIKAALDINQEIVVFES